jgi:hypothetical protein
LEPEFGQLRLVDPRRRPVTDREQHDDRLELQPAGHERQDVAGGDVQPLGVVDYQQERRGGRHLRQQVERGQRDQEEVWRGRLAQTEGGLYRRSLGSREPVERAENGSQQPVQAGESDVRFGLKTRGHQRGQTLIDRAAAGRLEQRRLADTRITADHERAAPVAGRQQPLIEEGKFVLTARQRLCHRMTPPTPGNHQRLVTSQGIREGPRPFG